MDWKKIIDKRKELWSNKSDIEHDTKYRDTIATYLCSKKGKELREELQGHPEYLIETFFVIVDKNQETVPFFLNEVQQELIDIINRDIERFNKGEVNHLKYLLLKGRQQGMTSFINAYQLARSILFKNFSGYTLADDTDNTEDIFTDKAKYYFETLPEVIKPTTEYSSRRELSFAKEGGGGMNSKWRVATAGNRDAGRSKTLNFFHGSEVAFWKDIDRVLVGLSEAFTQNAIVILETTANGFNAFKDMWDSDNNYTNLFLEWWKTSEYRLRFESNTISDKFKYKVTAAKEGITDDADLEEWIWHRLHWLRKDKGLDWLQLYWYYNKWKDKGVSIKQEYPCYPEEAYLATGKNFFNIESIAKRKEQLEALYKDHKLKRGYFVYEYGTSEWSSEKIIIDSTIKFVEDDDLDYIILYNDDILPSTAYTIGADTAGEGSDFNTAQVLDVNQNQVAVMKLDKDEDLFADQLYCLGIMYNKALVSVEVNFSTYVVNTLANREYPNLYIRESRPDSVSKKLVNLYGFNTNKATRPAMLSELKAFIRDRIECINDIDTLKEMFVFVVDERGKPGAISGEHDDLILALAIALYSQEQQLKEIRVPANKLDGYYTDTELEDMGYSIWEIQQYHQGQPLYVR